MSEVLKFGTAIDLSGLEKGLSDAQTKISALEGKMSAGVDQIGEANKKTSQQIKKSFGGASNEGEKLNGVLGSIGKSVAGIGMAFAAQELVSKIVAVRGEFQQLEISFRTMLGSEEKANQLMVQLTETASRTPFDLKSISDGARQLLAYGDSAENVNEDLIRLGNIASGLSQPLGDIVYLYGTTMTQGRLYTQDLNQFTGRGIPMMRELAKILGVAESEVKGLVEAGKVGFPEVQQVIQNLTNEGGMFYNLMQEQSKSIPGQISNIQDSIDSMFNEIGKNSEGLISGALSVVSSLVENYERVGRTLLSLVGTYGVYKVALMANIALERARTIGLGTLTLAEKAHYVAILATEKAQKLLNATMLKNPYVLVATAIAGVVTALIAMESETERAKRITEEYNDAKQATIDKEQEHRSEIERLMSIAENESSSTDNRREALYRLKEAYPEIFAKYKTEIEQLKHIRDIKQEIADLDAQRSITNPKVELADIEQQIKELESKGRWIKRKNAQGGIDDVFQTIGMSSDEITQRKDLIARRRKLQTQIAKNEVKDFYKDLSTATDNELRVYQNKMQTALDAMKLQGRKNFRFSDGKSAGLTFSEDEIKVFADNIKNEINKRGTEKFAPAEYIAQAKKAVDTARKELNDYINNSKDKVDEMTFNKEVERLKQNLKDAEDSYKKVSPSSGGSGRTTKQTDVVKEQQKLEDELTKLKQANEDERIAQLSEGLDKELELIENAYNKQKAVITKQAEEWKSANVKAKVQTEENGLTAEQNNAINQANSLNEAKREEAISKAKAEQFKAEQASMNEYLRIYGEYHEKRLAITEYYNEQIAKATTEGEKKMLSAKMREELSALDVEAKKTTSSISKLFGDMSKKTVAEMRKIANKGQKALDFLIGGEWDEEKGKEFGITKETFELWSKSPEYIDKVREAIKRVNEEADISENAFKRIANGIKKAFNATTPQDFMKALEDIRSGLEPIMQATSFVANAFSSLGDAFGSGAMKGIADGLNIAMDSLNQAMSGALTGGLLFGPIGAMAGATIGLVSSLASAFAKLHDARHEKKIKNLQDRIDTLEKSYEKLGDKVEEAYSKDASKMIEQQNTLLEQQKLLIQQQIAEEKSKKKVDEERIKDWESQIEDIDKLIGENKDKAIDAIFGEDLKSAINNFSEAYANAWANGTDKAKSAKEVVKKMMQQMVTESIKSAIKSSNKMEEIRQKLQEFYADNVLSGWEQDYIYNMAGKLQSELDKQFGWADGLMSGDVEREAVKRGIATASQESVDENNGRLTAIQGHTFSIVQGVTELNRTSNAILDKVAGIERNTMNANSRLYEIQGELQAVKSSLDTIADRGVRIKS